MFPKTLYRQTREKITPNYNGCNRRQVIGSNRIGKKHKCVLGDCITVLVVFVLILFIS